VRYFQAIGKTLDQPLLVSKFANAMPKALAAGAIGYGLYNTTNARRVVSCLALLFFKFKC